MQMAMGDVLGCVLWGGVLGAAKCETRGARSIFHGIADAQSPGYCGLEGHEGQEGSLHPHRAGLM